MQGSSSAISLYIYVRITYIGNGLIGMYFQEIALGVTVYEVGLMHT